MREICHGPGVEVVAPNAFPPADLIWFDGAFDSPEFQNQALGFNAGVEAQARASGLAPGWVTDSGDRILPVQWSPWAWWVEAGKTAPAKPERPLIPYRQKANLTALAVVVARTQGPTLGQDAAASVWSVWGTGPRDEGKELDESQALAAWATGRYDRLWLNWAVARSAPGFRLVPEPASVVPARVRGVWWNAGGWNRDRVVGVLARVWSPEVQAGWAQDPGWLPVNGRVPLSGPQARVEAWGVKATEVVAVQTAANE